jgi:hypothetical protein
MPADKRRYADGHKRNLDRATRLKELNAEILYHLVSYVTHDLGVPPFVAERYALDHWAELLDVAVPEHVREESERLASLCPPIYWYGKPRQREPKIKGRTGRPGCPPEVFEYAHQLRQDNKSAKYYWLRMRCLEMFPDLHIPPNEDAFRAAFNRWQQKRTK